MDVKAPWQICPHANMITLTIAPDKKAQIPLLCNLSRVYFVKYLHICRIREWNEQKYIRLLQPLHKKCSGFSFSSALACFTVICKRKNIYFLYYYCQFSVSRQYSNNKNLAYDYVAKIICNIEHWILFLF